MKRAAVGVLLASLFTGSAAMAGQGHATEGRHEPQRAAHSDHREQARNDRGHVRDIHPAPVVRHAHYTAPVHYAPVHYTIYRAPRGFYAHSWHRGERLPVAYYQRPYVIADYRVRGLRAPPMGYHWVRVDHDAVLAVITTGVVLDIAHHLFG